ncbi:formate dehydrogenase subunit alpha [Candidatus Bathyarchaeota archaeon]|nr:formate dehydrogenase subunit alpha [Candidatus Bathyarchaeota archaeon]MBL7079262.1 formate dehydrogenase subunit alpha [Candidatus Bathyarchaeota archaeon]
MKVPTVCIYCGTGCRLFLVVRDGRVTRVLPHQDGPGEGKLCIKGWSAHEFIHHPDRLTTPLIREGQGFREATWDEALDKVVEELGKARDRHGSDALGFLSSAKATNEENYLMQKLARAVVGTNNIDHCARLCHASTVTGLVSSFGSGAMTNSQEDIEEADVIFVIGSNTSEQHPLIARRMIKAAKKGARIIVADPREIGLTAHAVLHLNHRPGSDVALLNGMMNVILEEGIQDDSFIESRTEEYEEFRKKIGRYSPELVEPITGVPAGNIREAARLFGEAGKASIFFSMGITQHTTGVDNVVSTANLAMLTGNVGQPGTGVNPLRGQNNVQGACDMGGLPSYLPGYVSVEDDVRRGRIEKVWGCTLPVMNGLTLMEMINECGDGIRAMFIMGENPMLSDPDTNHVREQLGKLDFLVVSELFMSETAKMADVVLPAASFAEKDGTFTATDRRIQMIRKAVDPVGGSRPDWVIISDISRRLGFQMNYESPSDIMDEIASLGGIYGGVSHERLENEDLRWPCPHKEHLGTRILHQGEFSRGLGRFQTVEYKPPAEEPDDKYPYILTTGRLLFHWHTGTMTRRSKTLTDQVNEAVMEINPADARTLGVGDGDAVKVTSRRGEISLKAWVTDGIKEGVVFIPFHFAEAAANILTNPAYDPLAKIPELKVCAVRVDRIKDGRTE